MLSHFSHLQLFATPWTLAHQTPLSVGSSRQEYWSELPWPSPGDLPYPGTEPMSLCLLHWQACSLPLAPPGKPGHICIYTDKTTHRVSHYCLGLVTFFGVAFCFKNNRKTGKTYSFYLMIL